MNKDEKMNRAFDGMFKDFPNTSYGEMTVNFLKAYRAFEEIFQPKEANRPIGEAPDWERITSPEPRPMTAAEMRLEQQRQVQRRLDKAVEKVLEACRHAAGFNKNLATAEAPNTEVDAVLVKLGYTVQRSGNYITVTW